MTESEMKHVVEMQHLMVDEYKALLQMTETKAFEALDGLSKDLIIAEINAVRVYLAIVGIRIGLNLNNLTKTVEEETPTESEIKEESNATKGEDNIEDSSEEGTEA